MITYRELDGAWWRWALSQSLFLAHRPLGSVKCKWDV